MTIVIDLGSILKFIGYAVFAMLAIMTAYAIWMSIVSGTKSIIGSIKWAILNPVEFLKLSFRELKTIAFGALWFGIWFATYMGSGLLLTLAVSWIAIQYYGEEAVMPNLIFIMLPCCILMLATSYFTGTFGLNKLLLKDKEKGDDE